MPVIVPNCNSVLSLDHRAELLDSPENRDFGGLLSLQVPARSDDPPNHVKVAIIGSGPLAVGFASHLKSFLDYGDMILLTNENYLMESFFSRIRNVRQRTMRSSYEQHLAPDGCIQLVDFARLNFSKLTENERDQVRLAITGQRAIVPSDLFLAHCNYVASIHRLSDVTFKQNITGLNPDSRNNGLWSIATASGVSINANYVVIATGNSASAWPRPFEEFRHSVNFSSAYSARRLSRSDRVAVVGSGMAAGHTVGHLASQGNRVYWLIRNDEKYQCADFHTSFFRTEGIAGFLKKSIADREKVLVAENRGSLMLEMEPRLRAFEESSLLTVKRSSKVESVILNQDVTITFEDKSSINVDHVILATGMLRRTDLLPKKCELYKTYPILREETLEVNGCHNLFALGGNASLAIGPAAKNIDGVRLASERIVPSILIREGRKEPSWKYRISGLKPIE